MQWECAWWLVKKKLSLLECMLLGILREVKISNLETKHYFFIEHCFLILKLIFASNKRMVFVKSKMYNSHRWTCFLFLFFYTTYFFCFVCMYVVYMPQHVCEGQRAPAGVSSPPLL